MTDDTKGPNDPTFSPEEALAVFTELEQLFVHLDEDPLAFGPKRLNRKIALVRRMLDRCERVFLDIAGRLQRSRRRLRMTEMDYDLAKKDLFANDPETRAGRSVGDREAIAAGKLMAEIRRKHTLEIVVQDLDAVLAVIKAKRSDLRDTEGRLRDQIRLCQEELGLGVRWGSKSPGGYAPDLNKGKGVVDDSQDISNIIGKVEGEVHLAEAVGDWEEPIKQASNLTEPDPEVSTGPGADLEPEPLSEPDPIPEPDPEPTPEPEPEPKPAPKPAPKPTPKPAPKPEPEPAPEVTVVMPEEAVGGDEPLVATSDAGDADAFLQSIPIDIPAEPHNPGDKNVAFDDGKLLDFLSDFESPE